VHLVSKGMPVPSHLTKGEWRLAVAIHGQLEALAYEDARNS